MPALKPVRGIRLNKSHPLARGLVGYWLLNEGSGNKVFDLSGNGKDGIFVGTNPSWISGKFGSAVLLPGTDEYINLGDKFEIAYTEPQAIVLWIKTTQTNTYASLIGKSDIDGPYQGWDFEIFGTAANRLAYQYIIDTAAGVNHLRKIWQNVSYADGNWHKLAVVKGNEKAANLHLYIDGIEHTDVESSIDTLSSSASTNVNCQIGGRDGANWLFNGTVECCLNYNRVLSASEIALLYREPFCMFDKAWRPSKISGQIVELAGTIAGTSGSTAILAVSSRAPSPCHMSWLTEALFNGMTANAFKLGTTLSLGWFWVRVAGCSALYRGSVEASSGGVGALPIDFANILTAFETDACEISPPSYIPHNSGSTYFYVVRRFNNCGYQECTLAASVKVSIKPNGELAQPQPNKVFDSKAEQVDSDKIKLVWYYCPLEQGSRPICFNVYYDDRTGEIDFSENPLAIIEYKGRRFYSYQSGTLEAGDEGGGYFFAIRAEDASGIENISLAQLKIQLDTLNPDAIDILRAEAV